MNIPLQPLLRAGLLAALSALAALPTATTSAAPTNVGQGDAALGLTFHYTDNDYLDTYEGRAEYAWLFHDHFGLRAGASYTKFGLEVEDDSVELRGLLAHSGLDFYLTQPTSSWITYLGASYLYVDGEIDSNVLTDALSESESGWEGRVGVQVFLADPISLDLRLTYQDVANVDQWTTSIGFSYWFRK